MSTVAHPIRHRMSVEEFTAFCATDFAHYERYELVNGEIYEPMPESVAHADMVEAIAAALRRDRAEGQRVYTSGSVRLDGDGLPLPDVYVVSALAEPFDDYWNGRQLHLVVEVAKSTWSFDTGEKLRNYATGGVPNYYVVKLDEPDALNVTCYSEPESGTYRSSIVRNIEFLLGPAA